jgi:hypothetical protein
LPIKILLVSFTATGGWWKQTILARDDFDVQAEEEYAAGIRRLASSSFDLLVVEEWPEAGSVDDFLRRAAESAGKAAGAPPLKIILVSNARKPSSAEPPVARILPFPCPLQRFNSTIAELSGVPVRAGKRLLVRMLVGVQGEVPASQGLAATIELNAGGMLVECGKRLDPNQKMLWAFLGVRELKDLVLPGRVLREVEAAGSIHRYVVRFEPDNPKALSLLTRFLEKQSKMNG